MRIYKSTRIYPALIGLFIGLIFTLGSPAVSHAATFTVTSTADSGAGSLREAIDQANANPGADSIDFTVSGTITLSTTLPFITVTGGPLTIDGMGQSIIISGNNSVRVMSLENPNSPNPPSGAVLEIKNLTIANGRDTPNFGGGGILNVRGNLTVTNCVIRDNNASFGGGIYNSFGTVTINNSSFTGNSAAEWGGGVFNDNSSTTITGSTFAGNTARIQGGAAGTVGPSSLNITDSILSGNHAQAGGGIWAGNVVNVLNSTFSGNTADVGGAIYGNGGEASPYVSVRNSTFSGNSAITAGGAIYLSFGLNTVTNSTFSNNSAPSGGGFYGSDEGTGGGINNSTFSNSAIVNSFAAYGFPLPIYNTIVAGSTCSGVTDGGYNIDTGATCGFSGTSQSNFAGLLLDPQGLKDNGGQTKTIALLAGSTAVNAIPVGTNGCGAAGQTDQRGVLRPQGSGCDIGAFEVDTNSDGDSVTDTFDLCPGTVLPEAVPPQLKKNRYYANATGNFVDVKGDSAGITVVDTFGCSASQIVGATGVGDAHLKFGLTRSVLLDWIAEHQ